MALGGGHNLLVAMSEVNSIPKGNGEVSSWDLGPNLERIVTTQLA
jgi:hypothetical protein